MFIEIIGELALGFLTTLELFALTLVFALPLGLLVAFCTMSRFYPLRMLFKLIVWVVRGTPLMLQLLIIFYGPGLLGLPAFSNRFLAAVIAFVINYACYFSEIYRGGIQSISKGQYDAFADLYARRVAASDTPRARADEQRSHDARQRHVAREYYFGYRDHSRRNDDLLDLRGQHHLSDLICGRILPCVYRHPDAAVRVAGKETQLFQGVAYGVFGN